MGHWVVKKNGLSLLAEKAFLGASSDGRVYDQASTLQNGALKLKCPYSIDGTLITKEQIADILKKYGSKFILVQNGEHMTLKKNSKYMYMYYCQVQGDDNSQGSLVWFCGVDIHIECIYFNHHFWEDELLPKCCSHGWQHAWYFPISVVFVTCEIRISRVHHMRNPYTVYIYVWQCQRQQWLFSIDKLGKVGLEALIFFVVVT